MTAFPLLDPPVARLQRAEGTARLGFRHDGRSTRLTTLFQDGCARVGLPHPLPDLPLEAILINTAGGLAGGDRIAVKIDLGKRALATITTQACERIYRSTGLDALVENRLMLGAGARLAWLPQETILFDGGRLSRRLEVDLEGDADLLAVEAVLFGRAAMGEVLRHGLLHDRWRVRRDGRLIFAEDFRVSGDIAAQLARTASLGGRVAMATILCTAAAPERLLDAVRARLGETGGASAWDGKLVIRLVAPTGLALRQRLEPILSLMLAGRALPKVWHS
ncbi:MAG: urease accessory protein UreD [Aquamicrobium sp.]|uniref:urease accessory protein UreD n=1 Tax=Aquamicrobium sp. TaxID=1872579 RepID=UPI00349EDCCB|nr:urease accessory protein UreD [Aquamicrobium sp.]